LAVEDTEPGTRSREKQDGGNGREPPHARTRLWPDRDASPLKIPELTVARRALEKVLVRGIPDRPLSSRERDQDVS
jgi:hypothetical protein